MNEQPATSRTERIAGIFVVVALLLLVAGFGYYLYRTAERKGWRVPRCPFYTYVQSAEGLNLGDPVVLMGFNVGEITIITAQPPGSWYKVYVGFEIKQPYYGYVWSDSKVKIAASGLLGARRLEVAAGTTGTPTVYEDHNHISELLIDNKKVAFADNPKGVFILPEEAPALSERAEKLVSTVERALPDILALTNRLNAVLDNSATLTASATALTSNANQLVTETRPALTNLTARLDSTLVSANTNLDALAASLNATLLNLAAITGNLNSQVQSNDQILASISKLVIDSDNLVQGLKKHWLLRGVFQKEAAKTNAPAAKSNR
jgi:ABC-type transporter Mla subunit MlaD